MANSAVPGIGSNQFSQGIVVPKTLGTGIQIDPSNPVFGWRDMVSDIVIRGATAPTLTLYTGSIYQYSFGTASGAIDVFNNYHMLHDYLPNSIMYIHSHWSTILSSTGDVNWLYDLTYAHGYSRGAFTTPVTVSVTQTTNGTAFQHQIAEVQCSAVGGLISSAINVSITSGQSTLTSASALFTAGDIGRTIRIVGAGAAGGNLDTTISAYTSSTQVRVANNASTTVTTQPNFRYRVLDASIIETDGIILSRCWRDAARTADTLNVAPFLHFNDIHYQSTGVATRGRNYPFDV